MLLVEKKTSLILYLKQVGVYSYVTSIITLFHHYKLRQMVQFDFTLLKLNNPYYHSFLFGTVILLEYLYNVHVINK